MPLPYDAIVIPAPAASAAPAALSFGGAAGDCVLGLDQFPPGHDRGRQLARADADHFGSRISRHPDATCCAAPPGVSAMVGAGGVSRPAPLTRGGAAASRAARSNGRQRRAPAPLRCTGWRLKTLAAAEITRPFSRFFSRRRRLRRRLRATRGLPLEVEACVIAHLEEAIRLGAELRTGLTVQGWRGDSDGLTVATDAGQFHAERLVLAPGSWARFRSCWVRFAVAAGSAPRKPRVLVSERCRIPS